MFDQTENESWLISLETHSYSDKLGTDNAADDVVTEDKTFRTTEIIFNKCQYNLIFCQYNLYLD